MSRTTASISASAFALAVCLAIPSAAAETPVPAEWLTVAERTDFRATSSYDETVAFLRRLAEALPALRVEFFGTSGEGRPMPVAILSAAGAFTPEENAAAGRPVVMIQSGIHAGEIDGKDASLMLLRDMALGRRELPNATVLWVPIYNVDGHERVSPYNRPNQDGPVEGMGFRTTASGLDLNRDHLKLQSTEARALIGLVNRWRPHLHVDNHVTNGVDHDWVLTWSWAESPQLSPFAGAWLAGHMPRVLAATAAAGHRNGPYVDLTDRSDPAAGFSSWVAEPRYATGYYPLRHRPSILIENHSYKPYRDRVLANRDFLAAMLDEIERDSAGTHLVAGVTAGEAVTVAAGRAGAEPSEVVLTWEPAPEPDRIRFPVYDWRHVDSVALGVPILDYDRGTVREVEVDWHHRSVPGIAVPRPRGYLLLPGWPQVEARLAGHGLRFETLARPAELTAETLRIGGPSYAETPYQGLTRVEGEVRRTAERVSVPAGALWVPADQPDFEVAVQLLEPEAPDSLFAWGLLSTALERKEYIDSGVLEGLAREMLANDPALAAEWADALEDPAFAGDRQARWLWWFRRTPYWDDTVGRLPVLRVHEEGLPAVREALAAGQSAPAGSSR
jgi:hypothetical protein